MKKIRVSNELQKNYSYVISAPIGKKFLADFKPQLTPKQMLSLGVFGGNYFEPGAWKEFPKSWISRAKLSTTGKKQAELNFFKVSASQPLSVWRKKGWIYNEDPYGWFQWYCRYYIGRRIPNEDTRQIKRWKAVSRHIVQLKKNCRVRDLKCRPKQRQAILHWAYDSRKI